MPVGSIFRLLTKPGLISDGLLVRPGLINDGLLVKLGSVTADLSSLA